MSIRRCAAILLAVGAVSLSATGCGKVVDAATGANIVPERDAAFCEQLNGLDADLLDPETASSTLDALIASARDPELKAAIQQVVDASRSMSTVDITDIGALTELITNEGGDFAKASATLSRYLAACEATP